MIIKIIKRNLFRLVLLLTILVTVLTGCGQASEQSSRQPVTELFNGKDLEGWYTYIRNKGRDNDPKNVFTVQNGMIRISGEEYGCITTNEEFENYRLIVEFRWGNLTFSPREDRAMDSGILLHSQGEDGGYSDVWMHSIEIQMIEGGTGDFIVVGDGTPHFYVTCPVASEKHGTIPVFEPGGNPATIFRGRINWWGRDPDWEDVLGFRGAEDIEKPVGEWNEIDIISEGQEILVYLNGTLVNQAIDFHPRRGHIQIQSEGAELFIRRVDLIPL